VILFAEAKVMQVFPETASEYFVHCGSIPDWTGEGVGTPVELVVKVVAVLVAEPTSPAQYQYPAKNCVRQFSPFDPRTGFHFSNCCGVMLKSWLKESQPSPD
jgi:hypothetical protein